jgi:hypothetical protein
MVNLLGIMWFSAALWLMAASLTLAAPASNGENLGERQSTDRLVFCHFMVSTS